MATPSTDDPRKRSAGAHRSTERSRRMNERLELEGAKLTSVVLSPAAREAIERSGLTQREAIDRAVVAAFPVAKALPSGQGWYWFDGYASRYADDLVSWPVLVRSVGTGLVVCGGPFPQSGERLEMVGASRWYGPLVAPVSSGSAR